MHCDGSGRTPATDGFPAHEGTGRDSSSAWGGWKGSPRRAPGRWLDALCAGEHRDENRRVKNELLRESESPGKTSLEMKPSNREPTAGQESCGTGDTPAVSIVIPCRNEVDAISACMTSILAQARPEGGIEVIVADGMSDDGTREVLAEIAASHPEVRVIDNPGRIVPRGLHLADAAARGAVEVRRGEG